MRSFLYATGVALAVFPALVHAEDIAKTASEFGARQSLLSPALSPSGDKLLYVEPGAKSEETIVVVDLANNTAPQGVITLNEGQARIDRCRWATEERIVCRLYGYTDGGALRLGFTRIIALKSDGTELTHLTPKTSWRTMGALQDGGTWLALDLQGEENKILMTRDYIKEDGSNTRLFNDKEGLGVDSVDVTNGRRRSVEPPNRAAVGYLADEHGKVRVMAVREIAASGYDGTELRYLYRPAGLDKWDALSRVDQSGSISAGFFPVAVESGKNLAYGFDTENGYLALYSVALDGSGKRERLMARDDVDVDELIRIGRQRRVVGASYATERRIVEYFDPDLKKMANGLAQVLPGQPLVSIVDTNDDESKILLIASSDTDPGTLYLYDKGARRLAELLPLREPLAEREMGTVEPVAYPAADGTVIPGYLTLPPGSTGKNLQAIVMPHGGPGARDEWGFDWLAQFFVARGYAVLQPNYRGSAGYGEAWYGRNGFQDWETAIGDVNDAGRWLVKQGIADPEKLTIVGWSYGGYAALQSQVLDPNLYKAVVAIAPVTDLETLREESRGYTNRLTTDRFIGRGPHVSAGSPARHAERFEAPVLLVHGTMDLNVGVGQSKLMRNRLESANKQVDYLEFEGLDHQLEHSQARAIMLKRVGEFLDAAIK